MMIAGLIITVVSGFLAPVFFVATVLTANPCGAFGDACDDYGTTSTDFVVMLALTFLAIAALIVGLVLGVRFHSAQPTRQLRRTARIARAEVVRL
jgi:hypothetical protein